MREPDFDRYDSENTLVDDETWTIVLDAGLRDAPGAAETLGCLLLCIKEAIESGPQGAASALNTLVEGIHLVYPHTTAFALSRKLWMLSLEGHLKPENEPDSLLSAALQKGWKETARGRRRSRRRKISQPRAG